MLGIIVHSCSEEIQLVLDLENSCDGPLKLKKQQKCCYRPPFDVGKRKLMFG